MQPMMAVLVPRAAVLLAVALAACAEASPSALPSSAGPVSATPEASLSAEATPTASEAPTEAPTDEPIADVPPTLALEEVASGLNAPINITVTPDGWLLVNERIGRVVAVDPDSGETSVVLDIDDRVLGDGEQGLLGLALHPDWPEDARAFVHYSAQEGDGDTVLSEFRVTDEPLPPVIDATTERVLLTLDQPYRNHNGGQLAFGPDGYLYMGLGDGGSSGDPHGNGQNPDTLLGKILRIDVDTDNGRYAVPPDNPFVEGGGAPEVLLTGLRNPWRFSFDRETGLLWIGDVGQGAAEEIDRVDPVADAGANLGWNVMEGSRCFAVADCSSDGFVLPVTEYGHDAGCSVTGGYVYRGASIPDLRGWYLFSDYCSGTLFGVRSDADGVIRPLTLLDTGVSVSTFGEGPDGELYLAALGGGGIYRIVADD
jgi:glucose/arabinose dehydrogenase